MQVEAPVGAVEPAAHGVHMAEPAIENVFIGQALHIIPPAWGRKVPAGHIVQTICSAEHTSHQTVKGSSSN